MFLPVVIVCFQDFFSKLFGSWNHMKNIGKVCQIQTLVKTEKAYPEAKALGQAGLKNSRILTSLAGRRLKWTIIAFHPVTRSKRHTHWDGTDWLKVAERKSYSFPQQQSDLRFDWLSWRFQCTASTIAKKSQSKWQIGPLRRCTKHANFCHCMQKCSVLVKTSPKKPEVLKCV